MMMYIKHRSGKKLNFVFGLIQFILRRVLSSTSDPTGDINFI